MLADAVNSSPQRFHKLPGILHYSQRKALPSEESHALLVAIVPKSAKVVMRTEFDEVHLNVRAGPAQDCDIILDKSLKYDFESQLSTTFHPWFRHPLRSADPENLCPALPRGGLPPRTRGQLVITLSEISEKPVRSFRPRKIPDNVGDNDDRINAPRDQSGASVMNRRLPKFSIQKMDQCFQNANRRGSRS